MFSICRSILSRFHAMRFEVALVTSCLAMAVSLSLAGLFYIKHVQADARRVAQEQLAAIADLKAGQIVGWREERLGDARFFSQARFVARDTKRLINNPDSEMARQEVLQWLQLVKGGNRYESVVLFDSSLKPRLSVPAQTEGADAALKTLLTAALHTNCVLMSDLHGSGTGQDIHFDLVFPIFEPEALPGVSPPVLGLIQFRLNPRDFLYPLIQSWPTPSRTAETLLVRREGNEVLFLNDLLHRSQSALSFRQPLDTPDLPAAAAVRGFTGVMEGRDYRGMPVVAVSRPIPNTPWFMVAKMDREELYASLRQEAWMGGILFGAFLMVGSLLIAFLWRHRAAAELKKANSELEKRVQERTADLNAKNRELESFTFSVSHDLKSPLRGIDGFSELLLTDYGGKLDEEGKKYLQSIRNSASKMNQLIEDLLRYSRLEAQAISMDKVDVNRLINEILEECNGEIQKGKVKVKVNVSSAPFVTDALGLSQALRNLIGNALKFSSKAPEPCIEIQGHDAGAVCLLKVGDNGIGFDRKDQERIFEIFKRLPCAGDYPGTGIGLAIVRKSMQRMGGRVWAEGDLGKGATFFLEIPRH